MTGSNARESIEIEAQAWNGKMNVFPVLSGRQGGVKMMQPDGFICEKCVMGNRAQEETRQDAVRSMRTLRSRHLTEPCESRAMRPMHQGGNCRQAITCCPPVACSHAPGVIVDTGLQHRGRRQGGGNDAVEVMDAM